jgi:penicillin-binding protein 1A
MKSFFGPLGWLGQNKGQVALASVLVLTASLTGLWFSLSWDLPSVEQIRSFKPGNALQIKAMDGSSIYSGGHGPVHQVTTRQIPETLRKAIVATEDRRFYEHSGVDFFGIVRALVRDAQKGEVREGGSTITQQLARNLFLTQERTIWRKLREMILAARIEQDLSKEEILTLYLNQIYFGSGAYGVADASLTYFNKPVEKLNLLESALIAGMPQAPSRYSPLVNKDLAFKRRDVVLKNLVEVGYLNTKNYETVRKKPIRLNPQNYQTTTQAAYFASYIQSQLSDILGGSALPDGLIVETTLDPTLQNTAQNTITNSLNAYRGYRISQGAMVVLDPVTGQIRAMVGGKDFQKSQFNRAVQAMRQPGSTFKAFVYAAALESGIRPDDTYADKPLRIGKYEVKNYDRRYFGDMRLIDALKESRNTIAVQLFVKVGEQKVVDVARRMGIHSELQHGAAMALGASVVNLLELTSAYGTFANSGTHVEPTAILRIVNRSGQVLYSAAPQTTNAIAPEIAANMTHMLKAVITEGTGRRANIDRPAAGKTGTTEDHRDLLFVGYTPQLVAGVWLGNDDNSPTQGTSGLAAAVWGKFMRKALAKLPTKNFPDTPDLPDPKTPAAAPDEPAIPEPTVPIPPTVNSSQGSEPLPNDNIDCQTDEQGELVCHNAQDPNLDNLRRTPLSKGVHEE